MTPKGILLSPDLLRVFKEVARSVLNEPGNTRNRPAPPPDNFPAPDKYICWSPGIPAMSSPSGTGSGTTAAMESIPGQALCSVFQVIVEEDGNLGLVEVPNFQITVLNLSKSPVLSGWITASRDKFGRWTVEDPIDSSTAGGGITDSVVLQQEDVYCGLDGFLKKDMWTVTESFVLGQYVGKVQSARQTFDLGCVKCGCPTTGTGTIHCSICTNHGQIPPSPACLIFSSAFINPKQWSVTCNVTFNWDQNLCRYLGNSTTSLNTFVSWVIFANVDGTIQAVGDIPDGPFIQLYTCIKSWNCSTPLSFYGNSLCTGPVLATLNVGACPVDSCHGTGTGSGTHGGCNPIRVSMGSGQASFNGTVMVSIAFTHPVPAGAKVIVEMGAATPSPSGFSGASATFNGMAMHLDSSELTLHSSIDGGVWKFSYTNPSTVSTATIVTQVTGGNPTWLAAAAEYVTGLVHNALDQTSIAAGFASTPDTGSTGTTTYACEYAEAAFILVEQSSTLPWSGGFTDGGQDQTGTVSGQGVVFQEGYKMLTSQQNVDAALVGIPVAWAGDLNTYG